MIVAHVAGVPIEETLVQLAPAGAALLSAGAVAARSAVGRLRRPARAANKVAAVPRRGRDLGRGADGSD